MSITTINAVTNFYGAVKMGCGVNASNMLGEASLSEQTAPLLNPFIEAHQVITGNSALTAGGVADAVAGMSVQLLTDITGMIVRDGKKPDTRFSTPETIRAWARASMNEGMVKSDTLVNAESDAFTDEGGRVVIPVRITNSANATKWEDLPLSFFTSLYQGLRTNQSIPQTLIEGAVLATDILDYMAPYVDALRHVDPATGGVIKTDFDKAYAAAQAGTQREAMEARQALAQGMEQVPTQMNDKVNDALWKSGGQTAEAFSSPPFILKMIRMAFGCFAPGEYYEHQEGWRMADMEAFRAHSRKEDPPLPVFIGKIPPSILR